MKRSTIVVVPCRNEAERLEAGRFTRYVGEHPDTGFLFVDDASTDDTRRVLDKIAATSSDAVVVEALPEHGGKAEAVRRGVLRTLEFDPNYVGYMDADLATPLSAIDPMREILRDDPTLRLVLASRVRLLGRQIRRRPLRHYLGRVFATAASAALGIGVYDTQCGSKLFRVDSRLKRLFEEPFRSRWIFDVELIARILTEDRQKAELPPGDQLYEYPLRNWRDIGGSRLRLRDFAKAPIELLDIYLQYMVPSRHPRRDG